MKASRPKILIFISLWILRSEILRQIIDQQRGLVVGQRDAFGKHPRNQVPPLFFAQPLRTNSFESVARGAGIQKKRPRLLVPGRALALTRSERSGCNQKSDTGSGST